VAVIRATVSTASLRGAASHGAAGGGRVSPARFPTVADVVGAAVVVSYFSHVVVLFGFSMAAVCLPGVSCFSAWTGVM